MLQMEGMGTGHGPVWVESVQTVPFIGNSAIQNTFLISPLRLVLERSRQGHTETAPICLYHRACLLV